MILSSLCTRSAFLVAVVTGFQPGTLIHRPVAYISQRTFSATESPPPGLQMSSTEPASAPFPELCVFDLDACFWDQEMYTLSRIPDSTNIVKGDLNGRGEGVIGVMSGRSKISLHKGSLIALQAHLDGRYPNMRVCFASSADTPLAEKIGRATLKLLEVVPGKTVWDLVHGRDWGGEDVNQIGRQPPLSSNKSATHFPILREVTRVRYDRMLFFDDCQWGDHCGQVERACKESDTKRGPVTIRTPYGLGPDEWAEGLAKYAKMFEEI